MLYSIAKKSGSRREYKRIKKIKDKAYKNCNYSSIDSSRSESDFDSYLSSDNDWD